MRSVFLAFFVLSLCACESQNFESDKRQILAKDVIREKIPRTRSFTISSFQEDTLKDWPDSNIKHPLQYTLNFSYKDSTGALQQRKGIVVFAPSGNAILNSQIVNP